MFWKIVLVFHLITTVTVNGNANARIPSSLESEILESSSSVRPLNQAEESAESKSEADRSSIPSQYQSSVTENIILIDDVTSLTTSSPDTDTETEVEIKSDGIVNDEVDIGVKIEATSSPTPLSSPSPAVPVPEPVTASAAPLIPSVNQTLTSSRSQPVSRSRNEDTHTIDNYVVTTNDLIEDLLAWEAPSWLRKSLPFYLSGFDDDGRPIWVAEAGKFPIRRLSELEGEDAKTFWKYVDQTTLTVIRSIEAQNTGSGQSGEQEVTDIFAILDMDGMELYQLGSQRSVLFLAKVLRVYRKVIQEYLHNCVIINTNFVAELGINIVKPIVGSIFEKIEVYGTTPTKWKNVLRRKLPRESIPTWYGGLPDFKPVKVYG